MFCLETSFSLSQVSIRHTADCICIFFSQENNIITCILYTNQFTKDMSDDPIYSNIIKSLQMQCNLTQLMTSTHAHNTQIKRGQIFLSSNFYIFVHNYLQADSKTPTCKTTKGTTKSPLTRAHLLHS
jgi:anaerobic C4-dicarboxylate transporter